MKKLMSFSTALVLMLTGISTFSCGQKVDNVNEISDLSEISIPEPINAGAKVDISSITGYYQMEEIAVPDDVFYVSDIYPLGNNEFRLYYESKNTGNCLNRGVESAFPSENQPFSNGNNNDS